MYSRFQLAKKYVQYYLSASNGKGHGIHSPFVFNFIIKVLNDKKKYSAYSLIEQQRKALLKNSNLIEVEDFGAGSSIIKSNKRMVSAIASTSLKSKKYAQLLFRIVNYYQPATMVELGTSFGISSSYLALGNVKGQVYTCEGSSSIAAIAQNNFTKFGLQNIHLIKGDFASTLSPLLNKLKEVDLAFVDGHHQKKATLDYFNLLLHHSKSSSILIFDDIHWSAGMEEAWAVIKAHPSVTLTIDLFFIGIVFINPNFKIPQHFSIRF